MLTFLKPKTTRLQRLSMTTSLDEIECQNQQDNSQEQSDLESSQEDIAVSTLESLKQNQREEEVLLDTTMKKKIKV